MTLDSTTYDGTAETATREKPPHWDYEDHPLAELFPKQSKGEFDALKESIRANGYDLTKPIIIHEGKVLSGRARYDALLYFATGASVRLPLKDEYFAPLPEGIEPLRFILKENATHRHLKDSQRAWIGAQLLTSKWGGQRVKKTQLANWQLGPIRRSDAAVIMNTSERSIDRATTIGKECSEQVCNAVRDGEMSLNAALHESPTSKAEHPKSKQSTKASTKQATTNTGSAGEQQQRDEPITGEVERPGDVQQLQPDATWRAVGTVVEHERVYGHGGDTADDNDDDGIDDDRTSTGGHGEETELSEEDNAREAEANHQKAKRRERKEAVLLQVYQIMGPADNGMDRLLDKAFMGDFHVNLMAWFDLNGWPTLTPEQQEKLTWMVEDLGAAQARIEKLETRNKELESAFLRLDAEKAKLQQVIVKKNEEIQALKKQPRASRAKLPGAGVQVNDPSKLEQPPAANEEAPKASKEG